MSAAASNVNNNNTIDSLFDDDEIRRRRWILNSIPHMTKSQARDLWSNILTDVERESSVIVYKLLQYNNKHSLFHYRPWDTRPMYYDEEEIIDLPAKFINDSQAFIAITKQDSLSHDNGRNSYDVPAQFQDDFDAMRAVCSVLVYTLSKASDRLKDNEDLVFAALFDCKGDEMEAIQYASNRLQSSKDFILKCFLKISTICRQNKDYRKSAFIKLFDWMGYGNIFCKEDDKQKSGNFSIQDMSEFLRVLPPNEAADAAEYYPDIFFENEDAVLELMERLEPSVAEKLYRSKSKLLQPINAIRAMIGPEVMKKVNEENGKLSYDELEEDIISKMSSKEITNFSDIPEMHRINPGVLSKAVECKWFINSKEAILSFQASVKEACELWGDRWEYWGGFELYSTLPKHLQLDKEVVLILLELGSGEIDLMFKNFPCLVKSKKALIAMLRINHYNLDKGYEVKSFIRDSPFCGDKDFMVDAVELEQDNIEVVNDELFEDRDFIERVEHPRAIAKSSEEFQIKNLDLVEEAMDRLTEYNMFKDYWCESLSPQVWSHRSVVMKRLTIDKQWRNTDDRHILKFLHDIDDDHPLLNDKEIVSLSVSRRPSDLKYANEDLQNDKKFILKCVRDSGVKESERILKHISMKIRFDTDIIIAAIAKSDGNVVDCWNVLKFDGDEAYLSAILSQMRRSLQLHDMFMKVFLMGASRDDQHTVHPSLRSPLPMLNQGAETSIKLKKMIAEYAGVPIGQSYIETKGAIAALERFGISDQTRIPDRFAQMIRDM